VTAYVHLRAPSRRRPTPTPSVVLGGMAALWAVAATGAVLANRYDVLPPLLDRHLTPDLENNVFAAVSSLALLAAAATTALAVRAGRYTRPAIVVAVVLAGMALDEWFALHEAFERNAGLDWITLYLPIVAVAGVCGLLLIRSLGRTWPALLLLAGGLAWGLAFVLEDLQWTAEDEMHEHYHLLMVPEELLEIGGSLLFTAAAVVALAAAGARVLGRRS
jgi:hypothetical protein